MWTQIVGGTNTYRKTLLVKHINFKICSGLVLSKFSFLSPDKFLPYLQNDTSKCNFFPVPKYYFHRQISKFFEDEEELVGHSHDIDI